MKFKGRDSESWHKNIKATAGLKKPTDPDFPWIALQNHTGYYVKKKGSISQAQMDERLLTLIWNHPSKDIAIAASAHYISAQAIRNLLADDRGKKQSNGLVSQEYLQVVLAINHVNDEAVSELEARWARCLLKHAQTHGPSRSLGEQLMSLLPLLPTCVSLGLSIQVDIIELASKLCRDFTMQLETLSNEKQWLSARTLVGWLSASTTRTLLQNPDSGARRLLDAHLPKWRAWAAWRPVDYRLWAWNGHAIRTLSFPEDLLALEGPDFASVVGREQETLRRGLIAQGSTNSEPMLRWGKLVVKFQRNPFFERENLNGMLERLTSLVDFALFAGQEYMTLFVYFCTSNIISNEVLQILEGAQTLENSNFMKVILQAFIPMEQYSDPGFMEIKQFLPALRDPRLYGLREQMKPYLVKRMSQQLRELQNAFDIAIDAGEHWIDAAKEVLMLMNGISEETWLRMDFDQSVYRRIMDSPSLTKIESIGEIYKLIRTSITAPALLLSQICGYCKAQLIPGYPMPPHVRGLIESILDVWQQTLDANRHKLAIFVANMPFINYELKRSCLRDITTLHDHQIRSTLSALEFPNGGSDSGLFTLTLFLASEDDLDRLSRWREILLITIENQHEAFLNHALTTFTVERWLELLYNIRMIYKECDNIQDWDPPKLLSLSLYTWSQQIALRLPTLTHLETTLKHGPAMQMLLMGSAPKHGQLLRILDLVKDNVSSCHTKVMESILSLLEERNIQEIERVLISVSKARLRAAEACLGLLDSQLQTSPKFAEVVFATRLRENDLSDHDRLTLRKVARLIDIDPNAEHNPSVAGLKEVACGLQERYSKLISEARRLENLRLSLQVVAYQDVSNLLKRLNVETPSVVDDALAIFQPSLATVIEKISNDEIELQFPATELTKLQRFAIGAGDAESFLIRLTLGCDGKPIKFCVHLSADFSEGPETTSSFSRFHTPWEIYRGSRPPHENYCYGRPSRGVFQLSRIVWGHLRSNFQSLQQTYSHISSKLSKFGQGCIACGLGQYRLRRATTCSLYSCQSILSQAHIQIQLAEIWQDPPVMDLLLTMIHAVASTGKLDLLVNCPASDATAVIKMLNYLPAISTLAKHLKSCLNVSGSDFNLAKALVGYCFPSADSTPLAKGLTWACSSYRGFIVSATGLQRIPSFGNNQFLLANSAPDLEIAFARHMPASDSVSQVLFHGTSLDRLHAIICQGLRVQSGTALQRHGAYHGAGIYMADEPSVAWGYATATRGSWKSSQLKNMRVLLGCELAGPKPQTRLGGIYIITDATKLAVRYIFLLGDSARMPLAKDVRLPMGSVFQSMRSGSL